jgi:hypothetical protein
MANMPLMPIAEDPLSTDAEPASHPALTHARRGHCRAGSACAAC